LPRKPREELGCLSFVVDVFGITIGITIFVLALLSTLSYWSMDVTVPVEERFGGGRVVNVHLMEERKTGLIVSIAAAALGLFIARCGTRQSD
jgi:hypothetical protein